MPRTAAEAAAAAAAKSAINAADVSYHS